MGMGGGCDSGKWNFDLGDWFGIIALILAIILLLSPYVKTFFF